MALPLRWWNWLVLCLLFRHTGCEMMAEILCKFRAYNSTIQYDCYRRGLLEVPKFRKNTTEICLSENKIGNISAKPFDDLLDLTVLDLSWANGNREVQVEDGAFSHLTSLQELNLSGNVLQSVPERLPVGLKVLRLGYNKITSINRKTFDKVKNINELILSKNCYFWNPCGKEYDVANGSFSSLSELGILGLGYNNLSSVPTGLPCSLQVLDLSSNRIRHLTDEDFRQLTNLNVLLLQGNCPRCHNSPYPCDPCSNIEIHPLAFSHLTKLETLNLAGNSLTAIKSSWLASLRNLKSLCLSFNFLIKPITEGGFLNNLPHLELINLSYNYALKSYPQTIKLSRDFSKLVSLRTIHLQGAVFKEINEETLSPLEGLKNLSVLDLGTNFIVRVNTNVFKKFQNIKVIYLSENRLYPVTSVSHEDQCRKLNGDNGIDAGHSAFPSAPLLTGHGPNRERDLRYDSVHALVKDECLASGRVADLSSNNIFFISPTQFQGFENISCLNLSRNGFAVALNGTEFLPLPDLKYLDLSYNKIDLAYDRAFTELKKLEVLDLSYNPHYFSVSGITHNLNFLENLPSLRVLNLSSNNIFTLTSKTMNSSSLRVLRFEYNQLGTLWKVNDGSYVNIFKHLAGLMHLDISHNRIGKIPANIYENLPRNITKLHLGHNFIPTFEWKNLSLFPYLLSLDLSYNLIQEVHANLSDFSKTLQLLNLKHNKILQLSDHFLWGAKNVRVLDFSHNLLSQINQSVQESSKGNPSQTLRLENNPFHCTCDNLDFILWLETTNMTIPRRTTAIKCAVPAQRRGERVVDFNVKECVDSYKAFLYHLFSAIVIICTLVTATAMHLLYWDTSYALRYWRAKLKGYYQLESAANVYNAFVTYDTRDPHVSEWVLKHLRVELEEKGDKLSPICLEERDWTPGIPMIENLTQSVWQSRKTVFVLTEGYVHKGSFKMAAYLAHQRLLDDNDDVIVVVLLEPVLQGSHFLRLRKRLCGGSVLEWPRNPSAERWFWHCLRNAIRVDNKALYSQLYARYFTSK